MNSNPPENTDQRRPNRDSEDCIREFRRRIETLIAPGLVVEVRLIGIPGRGKPHPAVCDFDKFNVRLIGRADSQFWVLPGRLLRKAS